MSIIKYNPWSVLSDIQDEINQAFGSNIPSVFKGDIVTEIGNWSPRVDIKDQKKQIVVLADIPGVDAKDIKVKIENNTLTIEGKKESEKKEEGEEYTKLERFSGSFYRSITLPSNIDKSKVKAKSKNGVLQLTIPKTQEKEDGCINIEVE